MEEGFRFLVPLVRTRERIMKRTFITGKGDRPRRNDMENIKTYCVFQPQFALDLGKSSNSLAGPLWRGEENDLLFWMI